MLIQSAQFSSAEAAVRRSRKLEGDVKPFSAIPGPKPLPVLRNLLELRRNLPRMHLYLEECSEKYGKIFKLEAPGICNRANPDIIRVSVMHTGKH